MSKKGSKDDYEVGYRKPPKESQFEKGVSGNPTGRPKKPRDLDAAFFREANSLVTITENGRQIRVPKHEVVIKQVVNNAMKAMPAALKMYFALYPQAFEKALLLAAQKNAEGSKKVTDLSDEELEAISMAGPEYKEIERKKTLLLEEEVSC